MLLVVFAAAGFALGGAAISDQRATRSAISAVSAKAKVPTFELTFCHN